MSDTESLIQLQEFKTIINIPYAVIIASFIIIVVTTNMMNSNGVSALLGGYYGLMMGMFFVMVSCLIFIKSSWLDMFPMFMVMCIACVLIIYLTKYFERISTGDVSGYYSSFSILSIIFLAAQIIFIIMSVYDYGKTYGYGSRIFTDTTFALLGLFSVINILIVITIGVELHFYSTQG